MSCGGSEPIHHGSCLTTLETLLRPSRRLSLGSRLGMLLPLRLRRFQGLNHCSKCSPSFQAMVNQRLVGRMWNSLRQSNSFPRFGDDIKHVLDKGAWATMLATRWGGDFRRCEPLNSLPTSLTNLCSSRAAEWITIWCASIARPLVISANALPTKSVVAASGTRRLAKMWLSRVSRLVFLPGESGTEELVVDSVPAAQHRAPLAVAPSVPATMLQKKVPAKGKAPIHWMTRPHALKVTWVPSPSPGVTEASRPDPVVARPSAVP